MVDCTKVVEYTLSSIFFCVNLAWLCVSLALPCSDVPLLVISSACCAVFTCITLALRCGALRFGVSIVSNTYFQIIQFCVALSFFIFCSCVAFPLYPDVDKLQCHPVVFYFAFVKCCIFIICISYAFMIALMTLVLMSIYGKK
jgi:hypothetical protein